MTATSGAAETTLTPDWVETLTPSFEQIARALDRTEGFALHPVELTGPDVARALAEWMRAREKIVRVVEPLDDAGWKAIVATLLDGEADPDAVVVIGNRRPPPGIYAGLRLINQRRDSIVDALGCALLWCGPREFLVTTWEGAPDFWSIRALEQRISLPASAPAESPLWAGVVVEDAPERLREMLRVARDQRDALVATRIAIQLMEALLASGEYDEARALAIDLQAESLGSRLQRGTIELLRARAASALGDADDAARALDAAGVMAQTGLDGEFVALLAVSRGNLVVREDPSRATPLYDEALTVFRDRGDRRNEGVALANRGVARLAAGEAEAALDELEAARVILRDTGDDRSEARCVMHIGRTHAALRDAAAAEAAFEEALTLVRSHGDRRGEARILSHLARTYLDVGDVEKAHEDASRAHDLAREIGDARTVEKAEAVIASVRGRHVLPSSG